MRLSRVLFRRVHGESFSGHEPACTFELCCNRQHPHAGQVSVCSSSRAKSSESVHGCKIVTRHPQASEPLRSRASVAVPSAASFPTVRHDPAGERSRVVGLVRREGGPALGTAATPFAAGRVAAESPSGNQLACPGPNAGSGGSRTLVGRRRAGESLSLPCRGGESDVRPARSMDCRWHWCQPSGKQARVLFTNGALCRDSDQPSLGTLSVHNLRRQKQQPGARHV